MKSDLRILLLEDSIFDARVIERELKRCGLTFNLKQVETETDLRRELFPPPPDLVLSDHGVPTFDGFAALKIVRDHYPQLPFIFVSGSNHQGMVLDMFDRGATDYVYKHDLHDLGHAVRHALDPEAEPDDNFAGHILAQPEFKLQVPPASTLQTAIGLPRGHLSFCPKCRRTHDEFGKRAALEGYFEGHDETVVLRQLCEDCLASLP